MIWAAFYFLLVLRDRWFEFGCKSEGLTGWVMPVKVIWMNGAVFWKGPKWRLDCGWRSRHVSKVSEAVNSWVMSQDPAFLFLVANFVVSFLGHFSSCCTVLRAVLPSLLESEPCKPLQGKAHALGFGLVSGKEGKLDAVLNEEKDLLESSLWCSDRWGNWFQSNCCFG